jgi:hypothetical protein
MPGEEPGSTKAAPVVASDADQNEHTALRRLVGEKEEFTGGAKAREDPSVELSSPLSSVKDSDSEEEKEKEEENDSGRPNFRREKVDAKALESDRDWFNRSKDKDTGVPTITGTQTGPKSTPKKPEAGTVRKFLARKRAARKEARDKSAGNPFATPGKLGGALAGALSTAARNSASTRKSTENAQVGGMALALKKTAQPESKEVGSEQMEGVVVGEAEDEWLEEGANENMDEDSVSPTPLRVGSPTPNQRKTPTSRPTTPTRGKKRMACGTPAPVRMGAPRGDWSTTTQVLAAIAAMEARLNAKFATVIIEGEAREKRLEAEMDRREVQRRMAGEAKTEWDYKQWERLADEMNMRKEEIEVVRRGMSALARATKECRAHPKPAAAPAAPPVLTLGPSRSLEHRVPIPMPESIPAIPPPKNPTPPAPSTAPEVAMVDVEEDEIEEFSDMEGVQREGLYDSTHAPPPGEPDYMVHSGTSGIKKGEASRVKKRTRQDRLKARAEKGKAKEVVGVTRENAPAKGQPTEILRRAETLDKEKARNMTRWEGGNLSVTEGEVYGRASRPILDEDATKETATETRSRTKRAHQAGLKALQEWVENGRPQPATTAPRTAAAPRPAVAPRGAVAPRVTTAPSPPQQSSWAQRAANVVALPETTMKRVGKNGKPVKKPTGLEPIKGSIPVDERFVVFERAAGAPQILATVAAKAAGFVNIALSKVAPEHVRTEAFRISERGSLTAAARMGASAAMLLRFKKEIIEAARKADNMIINVMACESWVELKILVPYSLYRGKDGLGPLREAIEAENAGVVIPPFSMKWMKSWHHYEDQWRKSTLPRGRASVIFKVPNKTAGRGLLKEIWVAGNRFQAEIYMPSKADSLCSICNKWGHSEFRCYSRKPACGICAGEHRTAEHKCEVATCSARARICEHTEVKCPNCREAHQVQDRRCRMKMAAIEIVRGNGKYGNSQRGPPQASAASRPHVPAADWTETEEEVTAGAVADAAAESDTEMTASGTAPPVTQ